MGYTSCFFICLVIFLLLKIECLNINNMVTLEIRFPCFPGVCYFLFLYIWAGGLILRDISVLKMSLMCKIVDFSFLSLLLDISVFVVPKCSTIMSGSQRGKRKKWSGGGRVLALCIWGIHFNQRRRGSQQWREVQQWSPASVCLCDWKQQSAIRATSPAFASQASPSGEKATVGTDAQLPGAESWNWGKLNPIICPWLTYPGNYKPSADYSVPK